MVFITQICTLFYDVNYDDLISISKNNVNTNNTGLLAVHE